MAATVIHHSALPAPPFSPSDALLSSFNANVAGEERTILKREEEEGRGEMKEEEKKE